MHTGPARRLVPNSPPWTNSSHAFMCPNPNDTWKFLLPSHRVMPQLVPLHFTEIAFLGRCTLGSASSGALFPLRGLRPKTGCSRGWQPIRFAQQHSGTLLLRAQQTLFQPTSSGRCSVPPSGRQAPRGALKPTSNNLRRHAQCEWQQTSCSSGGIASYRSQLHWGGGARRARAAQRAVSLRYASLLSAHLTRSR